MITLANFIYGKRLFRESPLGDLVFAISERPNQVSDVLGKKSRLFQPGLTILNELRLSK